MKGRNRCCLSKYQHIPEQSHRPQNCDLRYSLFSSFTTALVERCYSWPSFEWGKNIMVIWSELAFGCFELGLSRKYLPLNYIYSILNVLKAFISLQYQDCFCSLCTLNLRSLSHFQTAIHRCSGFKLAVISQSHQLIRLIDQLNYVKSRSLSFFHFSSFPWVNMGPWYCSLSEGWKMSTCKCLDTIALWHGFKTLNSIQLLIIIKFT